MSYLNKVKVDMFKDMSLGTMKGTLPEQAGDKAYMLDKIRINPLCLFHASVRLQKDPEVMLTAISLDSSIVTYVHPESITNKAVAMKLMTLGYKSPLLPPDVIDLDVAMRYMITRPEEYGNLPKELRSDGGLLIQTLKHWEHGPHRGLEILHYFTNEELRSDKEFVLGIIKNFPCGHYIQRLIPIELRSDEDIINALIERGEYDMSVAPDELKHSIKFIVRVLKTRPLNAYPNPMLSVDPRLRDDEQLIKMALSYDYKFYNHIPERHKDSQHLALLALQTQYVHNMALPKGATWDEQVMQHVPDHLLDDENFMRCAISYNGQSIIYASDRLRAHKGLVLLSLRPGTALIYPYLKNELMDDLDIIKKCLSTRKDTIDYLDEKYFKDQDIMLHAIKGDAEVIQFVDVKLYDDANFIKSTIKTNPMVYKYLSDRYKEDAQLTVLAIINHQSNLDSVPKKLFDNSKVREIAMMVSRIAALQKTLS